MSFNFKMEERRWEELEMDCLLKVFGRVGMESLLLDVPFVCKSWHKASLEPLCWQSLIFPDLQSNPFDFSGNETEPWNFDTFIERFLNAYQIDESHFSITDFIKFVVNRSRGHATMLRLPAYCSETAIKYVAEMCPDLKVLALPMYLVQNKSSIIHELISKWKDLEWLVLGSSLDFKDEFFDLGKILSQVSVSCKNFCGLSVLNAFIHQDQAMAIVDILPNLKKLSLTKAYNIDREALLTLLRGCKYLFINTRHIILIEKLFLHYCGSSYLCNLCWF